MSPAGTAAAKYTTWRRNTGIVSPATLEEERYRISRFVVAVGERPLGPAAVRVWASGLGSLSLGSRRAHASTIRVWFRWCERVGLACKGTWEEVPKYRAPRAVPRAFDAEQIQRVLAVSGDQRAVLAIHIMYGVGLRIHEVARLCTDDIDLTAGTVLVRGKGGHERMLPLSRSLVDELRPVIRAVPVGSPVFPSRRGGALSAHGLGGLVRDALLASGVKRAPGDGRTSHCLRHTCASEVLEAGHPLTVVQGLLGHRNLATTSVYLRRAGLEQMRAAVAER